jgi:hypothetical protein
MNCAIAVFYCFPRSGGTLLNQCLLCHPTNMVLAEVNPAGCVTEPEKQATEWAGVLAPTEAAALRFAPYLEKIDLLLRRSRAVFASIRRYLPQLQDLTLETFSSAYHAFLGQTSGLPRYQLEELVRAPQSTIAAITRELGLEFAPDFADRFHQVVQVTGNNTLQRLPASARWTSIQSADPRSAGDSALDGAPEQDAFNELDHLAGYAVPS